MTLCTAKHVNTPCCRNVQGEARWDNPHEFETETSQALVEQGYHDVQADGGFATEQQADNSALAEYYGEGGVSAFREMAYFVAQSAPSPYSKPIEGICP